METKFTKGPWSVEYDNCDTGSGQWYQVGPSIIKVRYNPTYAEHEEWMANVRLISAAPELLKSLQETLLFCETFSSRWDGETGAHPFGMVDRAREAIEKATGAQP